MRIGLLGDLEVLDDEGNDVALAGAKLRALLAVLALHVGRVVAAEHLVEALWGEDPPAAVRNGLQGLVSKLRRALGSSDLVVMRGDGYTLELQAEAIDVGRFEQRAAEGRAMAAAGDLHGAVELLAEADALWRGDPLADFAYEDFAAAAITRLSESRLAVARGTARHRAPAGPSPTGHRPARGARRRPPAARAVPRAADAGALPRRPAGRRAADLPGGPSAPWRGARPRTGARAAPTGVSDPRPRSLVGRAVRAAPGDRKPTLPSG